MEFSNELTKAIQLVEVAYYDELGMQDIMRQDAAIYAAIAQAKAMERIAALMESIIAKDDEVYKAAIRIAGN